jgi:hypothetical protein
MGGFYLTGPVQWLRLALSKGTNRVGVSLLSPEDEKGPFSEKF